MTLTITAALVGLMFGPPEAVLPRLELAPAARALLAGFAASTGPLRRGDAAGAFAPAHHSTTGRPFGGQMVASDDRAADGSFIKRCARAIRSAALKPRISQSGRLTLKYRRPMGAQLGII